ncbi:MAG: hypothetical protein ACJAVV_003152 [Alphaproteobacteria bacterium]
MGIVYSSDSTIVELFDINNNLLGSNAVEANGGGLSFFGVMYDDLIPLIFRISITAGNTDISSGLADDPLNGIDLVVLDDLLYSEPQAVSAPHVLVMLVGGLITVFVRKKLA